MKGRGLRVKQHLRLCSEVIVLLLGDRAILMCPSSERRLVRTHQTNTRPSESCRKVFMRMQPWVNRLGRHLWPPLCNRPGPSYSVIFEETCVAAEPQVLACIPSRHQGAITSHHMHLPSPEQSLLPTQIGYFFLAYVKPLGRKPQVNSRIPPRPPKVESFMVLLLDHQSQPSMPNHLNLE